MPHWDDGTTRWDQGARWGPAPSPRKQKTMSNIATNTSKLSIPEKLGKGQEIITMSTDNPKVPGNTALVTALGTAQAALVAANAAYEQARQDCKQMMAARDAALAEWNAAVNGLAAFTESATGGDATDILSAGFAVKAQPSAPQPVAQVLNVRVAFTGDPGYSEVSWKKESNADAYVVECSQEPITATSWKNMETVVGVKYVGNGAIPGQKCWYRVSAVNRDGRGPWSEPALRPVM